METDLEKVWELIEEKAVTIAAWPRDHRTINLDDLEEILQGKFAGEIHKMIVNNQHFRGDGSVSSESICNSVLREIMGVKK